MLGRSLALAVAFLGCTSIALAQQPPAAQQTPVIQQGGNIVGQDTVIAGPLVIMRRDVYANFNPNRTITDLYILGNTQTGKVMMCWLYVEGQDAPKRQCDTLDLK